MTKSTITREQLLEIIETDHVQCGEASYLARMALAAMASEHKRNPVLAYADSYRDMANQGVESVPIWSVITDLERNIAPLYRHAQPTPVIPAVEIVAWRVWPGGAYSEGFIVEDTEDPAHKHGAVDALGRKWVSRPLSFIKGV
ncbi:TPA: hypothetical protein ACTW9T_004698 [Klebsiella pneumoniae]|jgi:hypothetical protein